MKKILLYALCVPALTAAACSDDSNENNTPKTRIETISFEECEFDAGKTDNSNKSNNTIVTYEEFGASFSFKNYYTMIGGVVIGSAADTSENGDSMPSMQKVNGDKTAETHGADGTAKFAVFNLHKNVKDLDMSFSFAEGVTKKIVSAQVNNSAALYQYMKYGRYSSAGLVEGEYCDIIFTGYDAEGNETGTALFSLGDYRDGKEFVCTEWTTVDLTALGEVNKVVLTANIVNASELISTTSSSGFSVCVDEIAFEVPNEPIAE